MRARNREINIFSISLLDILTGLLGAFLFLMLGLIPYYIKVNIGRTLSAEEQQQFEQTKKLIEKGLKGPLSEEEVKKLQDELDRLQKQNQQLQAQKDQLQNESDQTRQDLQQARQDLDQAKQDLQEQKKQTDFWSGQDGTVTIISSWDSPETDIDVFILTPTGKIFGEKQEKVLGRDVSRDGSDSHGKDWKTNDEGLLAYVAETGSYLVLYRIPNGATPQSYSGLKAQFLYHQVVDREKNTIRIIEGTLPYAYSGSATPGQLYAWAVLNYDADKKTIRANIPPSQLPPGVQPPPTPPPNSVEPFPFPAASQSPSAVRGIGVSPTPAEDRRAIIEKLRRLREEVSPIPTATEELNRGSPAGSEDQRAVMEKLRRLRQQPGSPTPTR